MVLLQIVERQVDFYHRILIFLLFWVKMLNITVAFSRKLKANNFLKQWLFRFVVLLRLVEKQVDFYRNILLFICLLFILKTASFSLADVRCICYSFDKSLCKVTEVELELETKFINN